MTQPSVPPPSSEPDDDVPASGVHAKSVPLRRPPPRAQVTLEDLPSIVVEGVDEPTLPTIPIVHASEASIEITVAAPRALWPRVLAGSMVVIVVAAAVVWRVEPHVAARLLAHIRPLF